MSFSFVIILTLVVSLHQYVICGIITGKGAVQYRIKDSEFNTVANILVKPTTGYTIPTDDVEIKGSVGNVDYIMSRLTIAEVVPESINVSLSQDNNMHVRAEFPKIRLEGYSNITGNTGMIYTGNFSVDIDKVVLTSTGKLEFNSAISVPGNNNEVEVMAEQCDVEFGNLVTSLTNVSPLSHSDLSDIFRRAVCKMYPLKFSFGFEASALEFNLQLFKLFVQLQIVHLDITNSTIVVTQMVESTFNQDMFPKELFADSAALFPPIRNNALPFEVYVNADIFNDFWHEYKKELGFGSKQILLSELLSVFKYKDIDVDTLFIIPKFSETFPNSTVNIVLTDADVYLNITDKSMQFQFNLTGEVIATLNCDRNRTYTGFKFRMVIYVPTQLGHDNHFLTMKFLGFGGNFTVLDSNIGHIADRWLTSLFYVAPQYIAKQFDDVNKKITGTSIADLLPAGLYLENIHLSLAKDHIIIGGQLSLSDPHLLVINKTWIGEHERLEDLALPLFDETPDDLNAIPEENCNPPPPPPPVGGADTTRVIQSFGLLLLLLLAINRTLIHL